MGQLRFSVDPPHLLRTPAELAAVHVVGPGERVEPADVRREGDLLIVDRPASGSARLRCPWPVEGFGSPVVATCSLQEQSEDPAGPPVAPHRLAVELARGLVAVAREQAAAARRAGVPLPGDVTADMDAAWGQFVRGACGESGATGGPAACANAAIAAAARVADLISSVRTAGRLEALKRTATHPPASLAVRLADDAARPDDPAEALPGSLFGPFRTAVVPCGWAAVEPTKGRRDWSRVDALLDRCEALGAVPAAGTLLDFSPGGLPEWLHEYAGDPQNLESLCADFTESAVARLTGRVRAFEVCGGANVGGALGLDEPTRLRLVAETLHVARGMDEENRLFVRVTRPFGDYLAGGRHRLAPLQFGDALARAGVGLDGITLELAVGVPPAAGGTPPRTIAGYERLLAGWSKLGVPLRVSLAIPAVPAGAGGPDGWRAGGGEAGQAAWVRAHLPLFLATDAVVEVEWARARDAPGFAAAAGFEDPDPNDTDLQGIDLRNVPLRGDGGFDPSDTVQPGDARGPQFGPQFGGCGLLTADGRPRAALGVFQEFADAFAVDPDADTRPNVRDLLTDDDLRDPDDPAPDDTGEMPGPG